MIDVTEHSLKGLPLSLKLHRLAMALRDEGECCWPTDDAIEVIPRTGGRVLMTVDAAVLRIDGLRRARRTWGDDIGLRDGALITEVGGQRMVRIADPISALPYVPSKPTNPRRVGD